MSSTSLVWLFSGIANSSITTCSLELSLSEMAVNRFHYFLILMGQIRSHSNRLHYFSATISRSRYCYKNVYVNSFLPRTAMSLSRLWNSLLAECLLSLTCDLNGFKLIDTFFLWFFSKQLYYILFIL